MRFSKDQCEALFPGRDSHTHRHRAGSNWPDSSAATKEMRVIVEYRSSMIQEHNVYFGTAKFFCGELKEMLYVRQR